MPYVVIYDAVSWTTGSVEDRNLVYHTASRGDVVPDSVPQEKIDDWMDAEKFGPHGAVAPDGSRLAALGRSAVSVAVDPADQRRRFLDAAAADSDDGLATGLTDPAGRSADKPQGEVDPGVARAQRAAGASTGTAQIAPAGGVPATSLQLDSLSKDHLKAMATGLGLDDSGTKDELKERITAHFTGGDPAPSEPDGDQHPQE